jgi:hypothetical protein
MFARYNSDTVRMAMKGFQQSTEEGNVICPFLKCGIKECQSSVNAYSVPPIVFAFDQGICMDSASVRHFK